MSQLLRCSLFLLPWCFLLTIQANEPKDELEVQLGCTIHYHKVPAKQPKTWVIPEQMLVRVTDANKKPLSGANVCLAGWSKNDPRDPGYMEKHFLLEKRENDPKTDRNGTLVLSLEEYRDQPPDEISITITCGENFLPFRYSWKDHPEKVGETIDVPEELEVALEPGEMVTYTVLDENGKGIPGVKATANIERNITASSGMFHHLWGSQYEMTSDANGKFQVGPLPLGTGREKVGNITLRRPGYASVKFNPPFGIPRSDKEKTLEEKSIPLKLTMTPGCALSGIVVDHEGKPLEGVTVYHRAIATNYINTNDGTGVYHQATPYSSYWLNDKSELTQTDSEGRFHFENLWKGEHKLAAIRVPGKYAEELTVDLAATSEPIKIVMKPTLTVRIRAVTEDGEVLSKIRVSPSYEGSRGAGNIINDTNSRTLEDGTLEWFEVPPDKEIFYSVYHDNSEFDDGDNEVKGYVSENYANRTENGSYQLYKFPPREEPYIVKMVWREWKRNELEFSRGPHRSIWVVPPKLVIRVLESGTGQPAPDVPVMMQYGVGSSWGYSRVMKEYSTDQNGLVGLDFGDVDRKGILFIAFKIEVDDSMTWGFSRSSDPIRGDVRGGAPIPPIIDALLVPTQGLKGIVLDENRKPIAGAEVLVGYSTTFDSETNRLIPYGDVSKKSRVKTDERGLWSWAAKPDEYRNAMPTLIQYPGYVNGLTAVTTSNADRRIHTLYEGKEVKGRVVDQDGNPVVGTQVCVENLKQANDNLVLTDEQGMFTHFLGTTVNGNKVELTAIKKGLTPGKITVNPSEKMEERVIVMTPGKPLTIRLKATDGFPLPTLKQFTVTAFTQSVNTGDYHVGVSVKYNVELKPDYKGIIYWPDAPDVETHYSLYFDGYTVQNPAGVTEYSLSKLKPREEEYVFEVVRR